ncbi:hypothetical protein, partial [Variovorax sp. KBW07]|uniref:hypothetical protein n=1 Tax=Variovorax sp. KBW07 TaxID=2153358 RepID=UPI001C8967BD
MERIAAQAGVLRFAVARSLGAVVQGDAHADGVLCSANVPRFAPPLFRCAEHTIRVSVIRVVVDQRYT